MNQFREQLTNLLEDGVPMPFSELQNKFESVYGRSNEAICTLENIRRLGIKTNFLQFLKFLGSNFIKIEESLCGPFSNTSDLCISLASPIRRRPIQLGCPKFK